MGAHQQKTEDNARLALAGDTTGMLKQFFKKHAPNPEKIKDNQCLAWLGSALHIPCLWHFNRRTVALAFGIGLFCMWLPFPFQTLIAAVFAILLRANLPLAVALVFISNPITIPPMFYSAYELGAFILNHELQTVKFELSMEWFTSTLGQIWQPLLAGCSILAVVSGLIGYYGIQLLWRIHLLQRIEARRQQRQRRQHQQTKKSQTPPSS